MVQQGDFEWDPAKAAANLKKHRVSFFEAATVFLDPNVLIETDQSHSVDELRASAIGFSTIKQGIVSCAYGAAGMYSPDQRPQGDARREEEI